MKNRKYITVSDIYEKFNKDEVLVDDKGNVWTSPYEDNGEHTLERFIDTEIFYEDGSEFRLIEGGKKVFYVDRGSWECINKTQEQIKEEKSIILKQVENFDHEKYSFANGIIVKTEPLSDGIVTTTSWTAANWLAMCRIGLNPIIIELGQYWTGEIKHKKMQDSEVWYVCASLQIKKQFPDIENECTLYTLEHYNKIYKSTYCNFPLFDKINQFIKESDASLLCRD